MQVNFLGGEHTGMPEKRVFYHSSGKGNSFRQLDINESHLGRQTINEVIASIRLACGDVYGGIFSIHDLCEGSSPLWAESLSGGWSQAAEESKESKS